MKITFLGLGLMGSRMASNILSAGYDLTVYNRTPEKTAPLVKRGAKSATTIARAVDHADIILTMLTGPEAVSDVAYGESGILQNAPINTAWIDCSTVNPSFSVKLSSQAAEHKILYLDAPVAGTTKPAESGELTFLVGGDKNVFRKIKPFLECMGKNIIHAGDSGKGTASKMIINLMLAQAMVAFSEALLLGNNLGLDNSFLMDFLPELPVSAPFLKAKSAKIKKSNKEIEFPLKHMLKDLHLVNLTGYENNVPLPLSHTVQEIYALAAANGMGDLDFSAIYNFFREIRKK